MAILITFSLPKSVHQGIRKENRNRTSATNNRKVRTGLYGVG